MRDIHILLPQTTQGLLLIHTFYIILHNAHRSLIQSLVGASWLQIELMICNVSQERVLFP